MKVHRLLIISAVLGVLLTVGGGVRAESWPIDSRIDLSSGFGNYRNGHFHAGVDIRTGGRVGTPVLAPVDGWVSRVKTSYFGYGKGLYLTGDNGNIYVFAHLDHFAGKQQEALRAAQKKNRRYYQDLMFPKDSIRVKEGEVIAYAGKTGSGPPHLHFEKRSTNNLPVNPLAHGYSLDDTTPPTISRIGFQMLDDTSTFIDGSRRFFIDAKPQRGGYTLDTVPAFDRPFGLLIESYDQMRPDGMQQAVYRLRTYVDDKPLYQVTLDTVDYDAGREVFLQYDIHEAAEERTRVRRLFKLPFSRYEGSEVFNGRDGAYGNTGEETYGHHVMRIVAEDCFGNSAELSFDFYWVPKEGVYDLVYRDPVPADSTIITTFKFVPRFDVSDMAIDTVIPIINVNDTWSNVASGESWYVGDTLVYKVSAVYIRTAILRLAIFTDKGGPILSPIFNGLKGVGKTVTQIDHTITDRGILFEVHCRSNYGTDGRLELYNKGKLLDRIPLRFVTKNYHTAFIPPDPMYRHIDRVGAIIERDTTAPVTVFKGLDITLVGLDDDEQVAPDRFTQMTFGRKRFYQPQYVEAVVREIAGRSRLGLASSVYRVNPEVFLTRDDYDISIGLRSITPANEKAGICWLDEKENKWIWLETSRDDQNRLTAKSQGGGYFAAVYDIEAPQILGLNVRNRGAVRDPDHTFYFAVRDSLSGFKDDQNFVLKIDGDQIPVEYDPESGECRAEPFEPLEPGNHHFGLVVTDQAGNTSEQYLQFMVLEPQGKR